MSVVRAFSGPLACSNCRFRVLDAFIGISGSSIAPLAVSSRTTFSLFRDSRPKARHQHGRSFTTSVRSRGLDAAESVVANASIPEASEQEDARQEELRPWYLQVQDEREPELSTVERQQLPDVPADTPEELGAILDRLSHSIGLDYLSLLDLRELNPPPALGSNLIMILGTARSEKHLNTSADRLCRWIRSVYKLQPTADGLLGRNELKLKLRRKSRRAKLLGGRQQVGHVDDGISTGWISIDIGHIGKGSTTQTTLEGDAGGVSGFGEIDKRVRLVVQMMTEEKRTELELEELWGGFLEQQRRKEQNQDGEDQTPTEVPETSRRRRPSRRHNEISTPRSRAKRTLEGTPFIQRRTFSNYTSRQSQLSTAKAATPRGSFQTAPSQGAIRTPLEGRAGDDSLHLCLQDLKDLSEADALQALGRNWQDKSSTSFLTRFHSHMGVIPDEGEWKARFLLLDFGRRQGHPGYTVDGLVSLLRLMEESCVNIPQEIYVLVLRALETDRLGISAMGDAKEIWVSPQFDTILEILENMTLRKMSTSSVSALMPLANELWRVALSTEENTPSKIGKAAASQVALTAIEHRVNLQHDGLYIMALQEAVTAEDWPTFWHIWRSFPARELPRSRSMYAAMFRLVAASHHQARCAETLTTWIPEMEHECPVVKMEGRVALAIMACIKVAEPQIDLKIRDGAHDRNQWVRLFKECYSTFG